MAENTDPIRSWDSWIREGYFITYVEDGVRYYEYVLMRDYSHWQYDWPEPVLPLTASGPFVPTNLEITRGFEQGTGLNHIWQLIFGIKGGCYFYVQLPTDTDRHGIPKIPRPGTAQRTVAHFDQILSPFKTPSFLTEHFLKRPQTPQISFSAYNPFNTPQLTPKLNIMLANLVTERIGTEERDDNGQIVQKPYKPRYAEVLDKLYRRSIPLRPITIIGPSMPAQAPSGE